MQLKHWQGRHTDDSGRLLPEFIAAMERDPLLSAEYEIACFEYCSSKTCKALLEEASRLRASNENCVQITSRVMKEMERIVHVVTTDGRFADLHAGMQAAGLIGIDSVPSVSPAVVGDQGNMPKQSP